MAERDDFRNEDGTFKSGTPWQVQNAEEARALAAKRTYKRDKAVASDAAALIEQAGYTPETAPKALELLVKNAAKGHHTAIVEYSRKWLFRGQGESADAIIPDCMAEYGHYILPGKGEVCLVCGTPEGLFEPLGQVRELVETLGAEEAEKNTE